MFIGRCACGTTSKKPNNRCLFLYHPGMFDRDKPALQHGIFGVILRRAVGNADRREKEALRRGLTQQLSPGELWIPEAGMEEQTTRCDAVVRRGLW